MLLNPGTPEERERHPVDDGIVLKAGDLLRVETRGGGGWGDPFTREPERVQTDVREGYVSRERAESDYGVILDPETLAIDQDATAMLRTAPRPERPAFDRGPEAMRRLREMGVAPD